MTPMERAFYSQIDPRRRQEISDARMIREDHSNIANLSPNFIHREFNQNRFKHDCNSAPFPENVFRNNEVEAVPPRKRRGEYVE